MLAVGAAAVLLGLFKNELLGCGKKSQIKQKLDEVLDEALAGSMDASDSTAKY